MERKEKELHIIHTVSAEKESNFFQVSNFESVPYLDKHSEFKKFQD